MHKSVSEPWVRAASSAQSRLGATLLLNGSHAETARWKRRVPRLAATTVLIARNFYLHRLHLISGRHCETSISQGMRQYTYAARIIEKVESAPGMWYGVKVGVYRIEGDNEERVGVYTRNYR